MAAPVIVCDRDTVLCADVVEWCPWPNISHVLICATYQLIESSSNAVAHTIDDVVSVEEPMKSQYRAGSLSLYEYSNRDLTLLQVIDEDMPGVFDVQWCPTILRGRYLVAVAGCDGNMRIMEFTQTRAIDGVVTTEKRNGGDTLWCRLDSIGHSHQETNHNVTTTTNTSPIGLMTSVAWDVLSCHAFNKNEGSSVRIAATHSDGSVSIWHLIFNDTTRAVALTMREWWRGHDYEVWTCAWSPVVADLLLSGADDAMLKVWHVSWLNSDNMESNQSLSKTPIHQLHHHSAGVCHIMYHPSIHHVFATGCYDEYLRIYDDRRVGKPLASLWVGDGVWKVKWPKVWNLGCREGEGGEGMGGGGGGEEGGEGMGGGGGGGMHDWLLVACMRSGYRIIPLTLSLANQTISIVIDLSTIQRFFHHPDSLCYGCDWMLEAQSDTNTTLLVSRHMTVVTCSFYDHMLRVWTVDLPR